MDARDAYECVITSSGVKTNTVQIKWHAANIRCIKNDTTVNVQQENMTEKDNSFIVRTWFYKARNMLTFELTGNKPLVQLSLYNSKGIKIRILYSNGNETDQHRIVWDGTDLASRTVSSGRYYYRIQAGIETVTGQFAYIR
jgi:flagellar hook assembly protein FlgD